MKRFLSVFLVCLVLLSFSVTCFAAEAYTPKTVELVPDTSTATLNVPSGTKIYVGDSIEWLNAALDLRGYFGCTFDDISIVFPSVIEVYNNGKLVREISDSSGEYISFTFDNFLPGSVEFVAVDYLIGGPPDIWDTSERLTILSFDLKDPNSSEVVHPVESLPSVFESLMTMTSELIKTIVYYPLLLTFVVLCLVGFGIGIFVRVKK